MVLSLLVLTNKDIFSMNQVFQRKNKGECDYGYCKIKCLC